MPGHRGPNGGGATKLTRGASQRRGPPGAPRTARFGRGSLARAGALWYQPRLHGARAQTGPESPQEQADVVAARKKSAEVEPEGEPEVEVEVEAVDELDEGDAFEEVELEETSLDEAFGEEEEDLDTDEDLDDDPTELTATPVETDDEDTESEGEAVVPPDASFDDEDDDEGIVAAVTGEDDDDQEVEGLRDGEFVCRSCYMAKRDTQLADPERLLCRDCA